MSFSIHIKGYLEPHATPALRKAVRFDVSSGVFTMPNRNMWPLLTAMDFMGVVTGSEAPPSAHGQVPREKFEDHGGHRVSAKEAAAIHLGLRDLMASEDDMEMFYDIMDIGQGEEGPLDQLLAEWVSFNETAAACDGYTVS